MTVDSVETARLKPETQLLKLQIINDLTIQEKWFVATVAPPSLHESIQNSTSWLQHDFVLLFLLLFIAELFCIMIVGIILVN